MGTLCLALCPAGSGAAAQGGKGVQASEGERPGEARAGPGGLWGGRGRIWKASLAPTNQGLRPDKAAVSAASPAAPLPRGRCVWGPDGLGEGASLLPSQDTLALCNSQEVAGFLKTETSVCSVPEPAPGGCWGLGQKQSSASRPTPAALWHQEAGFTPDSKRAPTPTGGHHALGSLR